MQRRQVERGAGAHDGRQDVTNSDESDLGVQLLYEDAQAARNALRVLDRMVEEARLEVGLKLNLWRFDVLCDSELHDLYDQEIAGAHILLVSSQGARSLPRCVCRRILVWLACGGSESRALVLFFEALGTDSAALATLLALEHAAQAAGVPVFSHFGASPQIHLEPRRHQNRFRAEESTASWQQQPPRAGSYRHWGLNE